MRQRLCVEGRRKLYAYLASRNVAHRKCAKLIVATTTAEEGEIAALYQRALDNDVETMSRLTGEQARASEPNLNCTAALLSGEPGIVDAHGLMTALLGDLEAAGGALALNAPVLGGSLRVGGGFEIRVGGAQPALARSNVLINAASLNAQRIARSIEGVPAAHIPQLTIAKGNYFSCAGKPAFTHLIYPAPVEGGLGVHLTLDLGGRMRFGPDVEWLATDDPDEVDYTVDARRSASFYDAIRRYWPGLKDGALTPDYSGCRPKLSGPGQPAADFRIDGPETHGVAGLVTLFGIESPGLTSSLAIGELAARLVKD
jgi:L-2-hydroxyglutarate oxidase LhgO